MTDKTKSRGSGELCLGYDVVTRFGGGEVEVEVEVEVGRVGGACLWMRSNNDPPSQSSITICSGCPVPRTHPKTCNIAE
jgi:hypothetical protein